MARSVWDILSDLEQNRRGIAEAIDRDQSGENDRAALQKRHAALEKELADAAPAVVKRAARRAEFNGSSSRGWGRRSS